MAAVISSTEVSRFSLLPITQNKPFVSKSFSTGHVCKTASCRSCSRKAISISASQNDVHFASVTESAAPAPAGPSTPAILGAGFAVAAGLVIASNTFASKKSSPAVVEPQVLGPASKLPPPKLPQAYPPRAVSKAAAPALESMSKFFPNAVVDTAFVKACATELFSLGFTKTNCIALVNTCRDEVCRPLATYIDEEFGLSFNLSGLGGLINSGKTGFKAGMSHSPEFPCDISGKPRERYVFFAFPHVSVGETGEVGSLLRRGRGKPSNACGALIAIKNTANDATPSSTDPDDAEFQLLRRKVLSSPLCQSAGASGPDLVTVTKAALDVITSDLERIVSQVVNPATADYAIITGIQIHSGAQIPGEEFRLDRTIDYVAPGTMYAVIQGKRYEMQVTAPESLKVAA